MGSIEVKNGVPEFIGMPVCKETDSPAENECGYRWNAQGELLVTYEGDTPTNATVQLTQTIVESGQKVVETSTWLL